MKPHRSLIVKSPLGWLSVLLTTSVLAAPPASLAPSTGVWMTSAANTTPAAIDPIAPAQQLFDQVNELVEQNYGGLSQVDRFKLAREYQTRLNTVCMNVAQSCPVTTAYPVIAAEITALGDEHSYFQTPEDFEDFLTTATGGERRQFGVKLAELDGQNRVILEVVPESAAQKAGLRRGDVLQTIDGKPYTYDNLHAARLAGKTIQLGLNRGDQRLQLTITPLESSTRDLPRLSYTGPHQDIAVLRIPTFLSGGGVAQRVHDLVGQAQARHASGMIVDLRGDTGGSLSECDRAVSAFVPDFTRISRTSDGNVRTRVSRGLRLEDGQAVGSVRNPRLWTGPLAVLVDQASASCSEFFAYEVQYARRGPIIGEDTAGVGNTATRIFALPDNAALQLTITNYAKPDGTPYPVRIIPDQRRTQNEDDLRRLTRGEDTLLNLAVQALATAPSMALDPDHRPN